MKIISYLILLFLSCNTFAGTWEAPSAVETTKVCGTLVKEKTSYDGVQPVFKQKDKSGVQIANYFLNSSNKSVEQTIGSLSANIPYDVCVVGFKSFQRKIDSPADYITFEIVF
jgi:hypothetical protein